MANLKILSLNVGMSSNLAGLSNLLRVNPADIVLLQEFRTSKEQLDNLLKGLDFSTAVNIDEDSPTSPGTAVAWKNSLPVEDVFNFLKCRIQAIKLGDFLIVNAYAPSGSSKSHARNIFFSQDVFQVFNTFPDSSYILSGDFNCILSPIDVENGLGFNSKYCAALKNLVSAYKLVDAFRVKSPRKEQFTFFRPGKDCKYPSRTSQR